MVLIRVILGFISNICFRKCLLKTCVAFCLLMVLSGCNKPVDADIPNDSSDINNPSTVEQYVKIYTGSTPEDHFDFYYDLYDKSGNLIKHDCTHMDEPDAYMLSDDLIKISAQTGTGLSTRWTYYYDLTTNKLSRVFYYVLSEKKSLVAFFDGKQIVVSDMFDQGKHTENIVPKKKLSNVTDPIQSAMFSDDLNQISIFYLSGENFEEINEVVLLE